MVDLSDTCAAIGFVDYCVFDQREQVTGQPAPPAIRVSYGMAFYYRVVDRVEPDESYQLTISLNLNHPAHVQMYLRPREWMI